MPIKAVDTFKPAILSSPALAVTPEQMELIRKVLEVASSDTQFVNKAHQAILFILTSGSIKVPSITSLSPSQAVAGEGTVALTVNGTDFTPNSEIVWLGGAVATEYLNATTLRANVNIPANAGVIPVRVQAGNVISDPMDFTVNPVGGSAQSVPHETKGKK